MIPPVNSLVKYDNPVLVSGGGKGGKKADTKPQLTQTEDILNSILPPHEWTEDGQLWIQYVSSTPATRLDVINVQEHLDRKLQERQARETGICPVREELYAQCFDELIRQVTVNCAERGLLLLRVRDEMRMTIAAYQTLYESSVAFGMRKALQAEQGKSDMESTIKSLESGKFLLYFAIALASRATHRSIDQNGNSICETFSSVHVLNNLLVHLYTRDFPSRPNWSSRCKNCRPNVRPLRSVSPSDEHLRKRSTRTSSLS
jgi:dynein light intermediate chain